MFSISFEFNVVNTDELTGEPSRMNRGVLDALIELTPRKRIDTAALGSPDEVNTCKPATWP